MTKTEIVLILLTVCFFVAACFLIPGCSSVIRQEEVLAPVTDLPAEPREESAETADGALWITMEKRIDINHASAEELTVLPGIGKVTAERIIAFREANGPFTSLEDLLLVEGIGASTLESIYSLMGETN